MPQPPDAPVERLTTRELLVFLRRTYKMGGWYSPLDAHSPWGYTTAELKAELAKHEHIPNKLEGRALCRRAAQGHV